MSSPLKMRLLLRDDATLALHVIGIFYLSLCLYQVLKYPSRVVSASCKRLSSPGIDSLESILGSLNVYKFGFR
jgi:hypothetical protein